MAEAFVDVSVVIPLYNKKEYITQTLESVRRQKFSVREIIIVDDGSTDGGLEIARAVGMQNIRIFFTPNARSGPSLARNIGIREAQSEYVAFLDADDIWGLDFLEVAVNAILENGPADGFFSNWLLVGDDLPSVVNEPSGEIKIVDLRRFLEMWISRGDCPLWTSAAIFRRQYLADAGGFLPEFRRGEDKELWLRLLRFSKMAYAPFPLALYRRGVAGQATSTVPCKAPPASLTALNMASEFHQPSLRRLLTKVSNLTLWHYTKINRSRLPLRKEYITLFSPRGDYIRFFIIVAVFFVSHIRSLGRKEGGGEI